MPSTINNAPVTKKTYFHLIILFVLSASSINACFAQRVEPMVFELASSGNKSTTNLRINNNKSTPLTVEIEPSRISLDEQGNETRTLAEDDFLIYPPQTIIQPGKTQVVKVKYVGDPTIETSQAYRVSVKQVPVDLGLEEASSVGLLINFNTLANVIPAKAKTKAVLDVESISKGDEGNWVVKINNTGNLYTRLSQTKWTISNTNDPSKNKTFKKEEVNEMIEKKLILPNSSLTTKVKAIDGFSPETSSIIIAQ